MKNKVKIISTVLLIILAITSVMNVVFATSIDAALSGDLKGGDNINSEIVSFGGKIVNLIQAVGIVVAVVVILVLGIQYIMGSAEQKAEYKKTMIPYLVGALLLFLGANIVKVVYSLAQDFRA